MTEPLDPESVDEDKELIRMWQGNTMPGPSDPTVLAREIARKVNNFDRKVFWRNLREYAAGALLLLFFGYRARTGTSLLVPLSGIAVVGFVMAYLWWQHRRARPLDLSADARTYQAALLDRYDHQIKLLSRVKYWYVLPLYAFMLLGLAWGPRPPLGTVRTFLIVTAVSAFVIWLNESYAVRKLKAARKKAQSLLEDETE